MSVERWLPVVGEEGYYDVSSHGRVRSLDRVVVGVRRQHWKGMMLKPTNMGRGYVGVALRGRNKQRIHQLVAKAFLGSAPAGMVVCHNDGDPGNNRLENLRYDTQASNCRDTVAHGRSTRGESNPRAKLTAQKVRAIRADTRQARAIADDYGLHRAYVYALKSRRAWAWLD